MASPIVILGCGDVGDGRRVGGDGSSLYSAGCHLLGHCDLHEAARCTSGHRVDVLTPKSMSFTAAGPHSMPAVGVDGRRKSVVSRVLVVYLCTRDRHPGIVMRVVPRPNCRWGTAWRPSGHPDRECARGHRWRRAEQYELVLICRVVAGKGSRAEPFGDLGLKYRMAT